MPGIDFSNDPLLQGRIFSYLDTQLSRLGSPNFHQLPINAPKCPFANHQRDGHMQMERPHGHVAFEPSSLDPDTARESPASGFHSASVVDAGPRGRLRPESFADHYSQARQFYRSQTKPEQAHLVSALVFELSKVDGLPIREAIVGHLRLIDEPLARRVADGLALSKLPPAPTPAVRVRDLPRSPALQTIGKMKDTLEGRTVGVLLAEGSDAAALRSVTKAVRAAGASLKVVAPRRAPIRLSDGSQAPVDGQLAGTPSVLFDAVVVLLSHEAVAALSHDAAAIDFVRDAFGHLKAIGADGGGLALLQGAGLEPDEAVIDIDDVAHFVAAARTRCWAREPRVRPPR